MVRFVTLAVWFPFAFKALMKLRGTDNVRNEMEELRQEAEQSKNNENVTIMDVLRLRKPEWKRPLFISIGIHIGQQFTGVNAVSIVYRFQANGEGVGCS